MNTESYKKAHSTLAIFDASSYFGRVEALGNDAIDLLHRMSTNDLLPLIGKPGIGAQTVLTNEKGRIIDYLIVLSRGNSALLTTSGGHEEQVINWLDKFVIMEDARFEKKTDEIKQLVIFGPQALSFLQELTGKDLIGLENFHSLEVELNGITATIQKSQRIIESGFTLFVDASRSSELKAILLQYIEQIGGTEIDSGTFEVLRIEAGLPIAPNELNEKHNPLETTLVQAISWTKGCYIGQEVIARLDTYDKVQRHLMGVVLSNGELPSIHANVASTDGTEIGYVSSAAFSPSLGKSIGLAFIKTAFANPKAEVTIENKQATLVKLPFELD
jgi:tRNA-modifying protein YgfZ